jgi:hypothetical protein
MRLKKNKIYKSSATFQIGITVEQGALIKITDVSDDSSSYMFELLNGKNAGIGFIMTEKWARFLKPLDKHLIYKI